MYLNALRIKLLVLMLLAVSGQVSGYEGERVDEGFLASWAHPQNHNDNPLEQTEPKSSWNSVAFQSMDERHKCQLSLDDDGLGQYGIQHVGDLMWLSIPDQGIEGVYAVIDIRSLKPPKIPSGDEVDGEAGYSYITGIFVYTSEDVWKLIFEGGEEIEVMGSPPFYDVGTGNTVEVTHSVSGLSAATIDIVKNYGFKTREAANLFLDDLGSEPFRTFLESAGENGVKAWDVLSELPQTVRTKDLNLEVASKLDNIGLHNNLSEAHKRIRKIVTNLDGGGSTGTHISNRIKSGDLDEIDGLTKVLNKSTDPGFLNAAKQTIDKADEAVASGVPKNRLVFEDEVSGSYDVDFGIKSTSGSPLYETGYQLKSAGTPNAVKNNLGSNQVTQIMNSPSANKVYEIEMRTGSFSELENIPDFWTKLNETKSVYPDIQVQVKDLNGVIKTY